VPYALDLYERTPDRENDLRLSWLAVPAGSLLLGNSLVALKLDTVDRLALEVTFEGRTLYLLADYFDRNSTFSATTGDTSADRGAQKRLKKLAAGNAGPEKNIFVPICAWSAKQCDCFCPGGVPGLFL